MCHCSPHSHKYFEKAGQKVTQEDLLNIHFVDDDTWVQFVDSDRASLLVFMLASHPECRRHIPGIIDFAKKHGETYNVGVVDVAKSPVAVECCGIDHLPMMVMARKGVLMEMRRGGVEEGNVTQILESLFTIQAKDMDRVAVANV